MSQAIRTKYLEPTGTKGIRIKAMAPAGSIIVPWDDSLNVEENHKRAAKKLMQKLEWKSRIEGGCNSDGTFSFVMVPTVRFRFRDNPDRLTEHEARELLGGFASPPESWL